MRRGKYLGLRCRGSVYTGKPGVPKYFLDNKRRVNAHDHSATHRRSRMWFERGGLKEYPLTTARQRRLALRGRRPIL